MQELIEKADDLRSFYLAEADSDMSLKYRNKYKNHVTENGIYFCPGANKHFFMRS